MKKKVVAASVFAACSALSSVGALPARATSPTVTVSLTSGLLDGQVVSVSGSGFSPGMPAFLVECSDAPDQPTVSAFGFPVSVSCDFPFNGPGYPYSESAGSAVSSDGTVTSSFVVHTGIVGPPTLGIDSAGHNTAADAALYPCPPTPAQQAAGDSCEITMGDTNGVSASVPISFGAPVSTTPTLAVSPGGGLSSGNPVTVDGFGFTPGSPWLAMECNFTPGEPTGGAEGPNLPVSCDQANAVPNFNLQIEEPQILSSYLTNSSGNLATTLTIAEGNIGASQQTSAYPCPPSPANLSAGGNCAVVVEDGAGHEASYAIGITGPVPLPTIEVSPSTGLAGGSTVQVTGANFVANQLAGLLECNDATGQPTISYDGIAVSVGCSVPDLVSISASGTLSSSFQIVEGVTGPPATGTDSAGGSATSDAADYPCPPTPAQQAAGAACNISAGDLSGDVARAAISFTAPVSSCSGATGNGAFLCALYEDLLGRTPDPGGLAYWESELAGGASRSQVAYDLASSPEYRGELVAGYYDRFLNRPVDSAGGSFWVGELNFGASDQDILRGILGSAEFYADSGGTATGLVTALYEDLLGRPPDPGGLAYWEGQIAAGASHGTVVGGIASSTEYKVDFVEAQYSALLERAADPAGLFYWVAQMAGGASDETVIAGIAGSAEFYALSM